MVKVQQKIQRAINALSYFLHNEWTFASDNLTKMQSMLSDSDRKLFSVDTTKIEWSPYLESYVRGVKRYILKEDDSDLPKARKHLGR